MNSPCLLSLALLLVIFAGCKRQEAAPVETQPLAVQVTHVETNTSMKSVLSAQGSLRVKEAAAISARIPGTIDSIKVEEGASVTAGTVLFSVDQVNLRNAVRGASDDLAIGKAKKAEAEAALEKATKDQERLRRLLKSDAVTQDAVERAELQYKIARAALASANALITKCEAALAIAKKNLSDAVIVAPFTGRLTRKFKNVGDYASPGTPVFFLEDSAIHEVTCQLNSDHYGEVEVGKTLLVARNPSSIAGKSFPITYKAASVNAKSRTFEVRAQVPKGKDMISGMIIDAQIVTRTFRAATLPVSALAYRNEKWVVFTVENGKTVSHAVQRGREYGGRVEIVNAAEFDGKDIVESGILLLNEDERVRVK